MPVVGAVIFWTFTAIGIQVHLIILIGILIIMVMVVLFGFQSGYGVHHGIIMVSGQKRLHRVSVLLKTKKFVMMVLYQFSMSLMTIAELNATHIGTVRLPELIYIMMVH